MGCVYGNVVMISSSDPHCMVSGFNVHLQKGLPRVNVIKGVYLKFAFCWDFALVLLHI